MFDMVVDASEGKSWWRDPEGTESGQTPRRDSHIRDKIAKPKEAPEQLTYDDMTRDEYDLAVESLRDLVRSGTALKGSDCQQNRQD